MSGQVVVSLFPDVRDNVIFNSTTRFSYADVEKFVTEAEVLRKLVRDDPSSAALCCTMFASVYREPLGKYSKHFPSEHSWLVDPHQEMVAKRLVRIFYRPSTIPQSDNDTTMLQIQGIIDTFRFEFPNRRMELMNLLEGTL